MFHMTFEYVQYFRCPECGSQRGNSGPATCSFLTGSHTNQALCILRGHVADELCAEQIEH